MLEEVYFHLPVSDCPVSTNVEQYFSSIIPVTIPISRAFSSNQWQELPPNLTLGELDFHLFCLLARHFFFFLLWSLGISGFGCLGGHLHSNMQPGFRQWLLLVCKTVKWPRVLKLPCNLLYKHKLATIKVKKWSFCSTEIPGMNEV